MLHLCIRSGALKLGLNLLTRFEILCSVTFWKTYVRFFQLNWGEIHERVGQLMWTQLKQCNDFFVVVGGCEYDKFGVLYSIVKK